MECLCIRGNCYETTHTTKHNNMYMESYGDSYTVHPNGADMSCLLSPTLNLERKRIMRMMNKCKSRYEVQADYGHGFVCVATENSMSAAKETLRRCVIADGMRTKYRIKKY